jgi:hypothetical protein
MAYRHPRIPLSRERKMRAFWTRSFTPAGEVDLLLAEIHPNPERSGCPGLWFVWTMAKRQLPDDHPAYSHLTECSPCYREYRGIQQTEWLLWTWQFRMSRAARGVCVRLLRRLRRARDTRRLQKAHDGGTRSSEPEDGSGGEVQAPVHVLSQGEGRQVTRCSLDRETSRR